MMTDVNTAKPLPGRYGVWTAGAPTPEQAAEIERLGYGAVWVGGSPAADLAFVEPILAATSRLSVATGIVNIWTAAAGPIAESFHRIEAAHPGRFLLGIGCGHPEVTSEYRSPYEALVQYLDALDAAGVPPERRVVAALGPRMLQLAADRSAGAHPYLTTPEHTASARALVGPSTFLAPEHKVVLGGNDADAAQARALGRESVGFYLALSNYARNWRRLGFSDDDLRPPGSDRFIDAVVAHGGADAVAARLAEHLTAGADQVAIQVLGGWKRLLPTLTELAGPLGLG